jgi:hypothetical protein
MFAMYPQVEHAGVAVECHRLSERHTAFAIGFARDDDPPREQQRLESATPQAEAERSPRRMTHDLGWDAIMLVTVGR